MFHEMKKVPKNRGSDHLVPRQEDSGQFAARSVGEICEEAAETVDREPVPSNGANKDAAEPLELQERDTPENLVKSLERSQAEFPNSKPNKSPDQSKKTTPPKQANVGTPERVITPQEERTPSRSSKASPKNTVEPRELAVQEKNSDEATTKPDDRASPRSPNSGASPDLANTDPDQNDSIQLVRRSSGRRSTKGSQKKRSSVKRPTDTSLAAAPPVNEAARYSTYNKIQDPMKNHEQYLKTHYDRIKRIHAIHAKGTVDCGTPLTFGKYLSRFDVVQRWALVNLDRANYVLFELLSSSHSHYDHKAWMAEYDRRRKAMDQKLRHTKIWPRNRKFEEARRLPVSAISRLERQRTIRNNGLQD